MKKLRMLLIALTLLTAAAQGQSHRYKLPANAQVIEVQPATVWYFVWVLH